MIGYLSLGNKETQNLTKENPEVRNSSQKWVRCCFKLNIMMWGFENKKPRSDGKPRSVWEWNTKTQKCMGVKCKKKKQKWNTENPEERDLGALLIWDTWSHVHMQSYKKCVGNCGAGVGIFMMWGGMCKIDVLHTYYYCKYTSAHTYYLVLLQVHTIYVHTTTTGTPVHTSTLHHHYYYYYMYLAPVWYTTHTY